MVGKNYEGKFLYEFIFSNTTKNIDGDEWDTFPASGRPEAVQEGFAGLYAFAGDAQLGVRGVFGVSALTGLVDLN